LGSQLVSYTRARAEGVGYTCKTGLLTRVERVLLLGVFDFRHAVGFPAGELHARAG